MNPSAPAEAEAAVWPKHHYLNTGTTVKSWLLTRDHKRIALLYLASITFFFFIGGAFAVLIRLDLATPAGDRAASGTVPGKATTSCARSGRGSRRRVSASPRSSRPQR